MSTNMTASPVPHTVTEALPFPSTPSLGAQESGVNRSPSPTVPPGSRRRRAAASWLSRLYSVRNAGESGRRGFHPFFFVVIIFRSEGHIRRAVNLLWPTVPAAVVLRYTRPESHLAIFVLAYLAMVPCASMLAFAGGQLARKLPHVLGVVGVIMLDSSTEVILLLVLISSSGKNGVDNIPVIKAAILGSMLATMLLCLGLCFLVAGLKRQESAFSKTVSETGSALLFIAAFGLAVPTAFGLSLSGKLEEADLQSRTLTISRGMAILLVVSYLAFILFQLRTHQGIYDAIFVEDEYRDENRPVALRMRRLTATEVAVALVISIGLIILISFILDDQISYLVLERHVSEAFVGLFLVPIVEKTAEHLGTISEANNNQMSIALSHVLGGTIQTALLSGPLIVLVGWGIDKPMGLDFNLFDMVVLMLAVLAVGNFLRDQTSTYLQGVLSIILYVAIGVAALYYPNLGRG